jgi:hypothetical protein
MSSYRPSIRNVFEIPYSTTLYNPSFTPFTINIVGGDRLMACDEIVEISLVSPVFFSVIYR